MEISFDIEATLDTESCGEDDQSFAQFCSSSIRADFLKAKTILDLTFLAEDQRARHRAGAAQDPKNCEYGR
jgi:hypothetical protein